VGARLVVADGVESVGAAAALVVVLASEPARGAGGATPVGGTTTVEALAVVVGLVLETAAFAAVVVVAGADAGSWRNVRAGSEHTVSIATSTGCFASRPKCHPSTSPSVTSLDPAPQLEYAYAVPPSAR
jgi:hypothetical protein